MSNIQIRKKPSNLSLGSLKSSNPIVESTPKTPIQKRPTATIISLVRIGALPLIMILYLSGGYAKFVALILFVASAAIEWSMDTLARKDNNSFTDTGWMLTRLANKTLLLVGFVLVATDFGILVGNISYEITGEGILLLPMPIWLMVIALFCALGRDIVIDGLRSLASHKGTKLAGDNFARFTVVAIAFLMGFASLFAFNSGFAETDFGMFFQYVAFFVFVTATVMNIASIVIYLHKNRGIFAENKRKFQESIKDPSQLLATTAKTPPQKKASSMTISLIRLAVLPCIIFFYLSGGIIGGWLFFAEFGKLIALILFIDVIAAEWLANILAKRRNESFTDASKIFTRIINKLVMLVGLVLVATDIGFLVDSFYPSGFSFLPMPAWLAVIALVCILGRDLVINSLRSMAAKMDVKLGISKFGKATIVLQRIAIALLMFYAFAAMHHFFGLGNVNVVVEIYEFTAVFVFVIATALGIISTGAYLYQSRELYIKSKPKKEWGGK